VLSCLVGKRCPSALRQFTSGMTGDLADAKHALLGDRRVMQPQAGTARTAARPSRILIVDDHEVSLADPPTVDREIARIWFFRITADLCVEAI